MSSLTPTSEQTRDNHDHPLAILANPYQRYDSAPAFVTLQEQQHLITWSLLILRIVLSSP